MDTTVPTVDWQPLSVETVADWAELTNLLAVVDATGLSGPSDPDLSKVSTMAGDWAEGELSEVMSEPKLVADVVATSGVVAATRSRKAKVAAIARAFSTWRSIRSDNVSSPCRNRNALSGASAAPRSRRVSARSFIR